MASERPLLPQSSQNSGFSFAPRDAPQQRNYVFVDEHNRHKRLKVMRACEGCRRRKIKCDAATTNSWPCAACTRLKLNCVPPTVCYEKDPSAPGVHTFELQRNDYPTIPVGTISDYQRQPPHPQNQYPVPANLHPQIAGHYIEDVPVYQHGNYGNPAPQPEALSYSSVAPVSMPAQEMRYQSSYTTPPPASHQNNMESWKPESPSITSSTVDSLSEVMGELKINHLATAPYIADRERLRNAPAVQEFEVTLPQNISGDSTIRIPPEMMPNDQQAMQYFNYFFAHIHPYVPVLHQTAFYQTWNTNRELHSPLLLEAIFAVTTMTLEDHDQGNKWLALATRHEESYRDVPRLSTIQAALILLKARESAPKRGYFYRSWMIVVNAVAMSKDLNMHEHVEDHDLGRSCNNSVLECGLKTRIWQLLYVLEAMIGGPQGRLDFNVNEASVDLKPVRPMPGQDEVEFQTSYQFVWFARVVKNVRTTINIYSRLKKSKDDWAADPVNTEHNESFPRWIQELPRDLQITFPTDGSSPWVESSFLGNMHCYHYLSVIMHHRPQMHYLTETDGDWRRHMLVCHGAAKSMCRIQESILQTYGMVGLMCMQRGISFTIYCVLTCTMLHLASITSPDPALNTEGRDFFVRHMRILEQCTPHWQMPEVHAQINALREAFSVNTSRPFELKPSFPFGSPTQTQHQTSPLADGAYISGPQGHGVSLSPAGQVTYMTPISPPISTTDEVPKADSPVGQSLVMMATQGQHPTAAVSNQDFNHQWNPAKIFNQWNAAFGTPPSSSASQPSPPLRQQPPGTYDANQDMSQHAYSPQTVYSAHSGNNMQLPTNVPAPPSAYTSAPPMPTGYVTPTMWQDVVANSIVQTDGRKRVWDYGGQAGLSQMAKRQQR
ncbi:hypothetical protein E6O75_ATG11542 [Venturia nashicola]|uniref:Zn(2)-C6 fungal-type domain-containing protein n=1 Tax=Venturia nashicola TaxID=86259 RepID=A0A4Z1NYV9_9PEZI|nr:hypothetical protein E6O75_ATG11542 [Venturia nashicola]